MTASRVFESLFGTDLNGELNGPRPYQFRVAEALRSRRNVVLTAPTGSGKTLAVLAPFIAFRGEMGVRRLIYCLPMRTLALGIYAEAKAIAEQGPSPLRVTLQTGDHPEDPFFDDGDIVICTYDQLLSGLLCHPYSLSRSQRNLNAASVAGNLIVFDEFHLMEVDRAFLTAATCLSWFAAVCQSVWMTATATHPLVEYLRANLTAELIELAPTELETIQPDRALEKVDFELTSEEILRFRGQRVLIVVNTVKRAQSLFEALIKAEVPREQRILLHARFFSSDKETKRRRLYELFGKGTTAVPCMMIATQVVEAGLDISAEVLLTELAPMNALLQRAGRCARFGDRGIVRVYRTPETSALPYGSEELQRTWEVLENRDPVTIECGLRWINAVHQESDAKALRSAGDHRKRCRNAVHDRVLDPVSEGISDLIRRGSPSVSLMIQANPIGIRPGTRESISAPRGSVEQVVKLHPGVAYQYAPDDRVAWWEQSDDVRLAYLVALPPTVAKYSFDLGLQLGENGTEESPKLLALDDREPFQYERESWIEHTQRVAQRLEQRIVAEFSMSRKLGEGVDFQRFRQAGELSAKLHDLGKLQADWQDWAFEYERSREPGFLRVLLAHTTSRNSADRRLERSLGRRRPPHSYASTCYASKILANDVDNREVILAAVVSHHGGWFTSQNVSPLSDGAELEVRKLGFQFPIMRGSACTHMGDLQKDAEDVILNEFPKHWPFYSMLVRHLRLADQQATREASELQ